MRLIDADLLINCIIKSLNKALLKGTIREKGFEVYALTKFIEIVDAVPTEEPVKHGKWDVIYFDEPSECDIYGCSECKKTTGIIQPEWNFCPNCGARMDGDK